jgi:hypothetical protein
MADETEGAADSLELFTDPVCNIFAMVCFIVILMVVLSSMRQQVVRRVEQQAARTDPVPATVEELRLRVAEIERPEIQVRIGEIAALQQALERKQAVQREAERREDLMVTELMDSGRGAQVAERLVPDLQQEIVRLEHAIRDAEARSEVALALPRERRVRDSLVAAMALDQGSAYMITPVPTVFEPMSMCDFVRMLDEDCVDVARSTIECQSVEGRGTQRIELRPEGGVSLRQPGWQSSPKWKRWLAALRSKPRVVVYLTVGPDSHPEFLILRKALQEAGVFYNVESQRPPFRLEWVYGTPTSQ